MTTENLKCEVCGQTEGVAFYEWPIQEVDESAGVTVCPEHASENGFCWVCGYFVLGSNEDRTLNNYGVCSECYEELRYENGELYDFDDGEYDDINY